MKDKKQPVEKRKTFKVAVEATPEVAKCYRVGKQAIEGKDRDKFIFADQAECGGSLNIDKCLLDKRLYMDASRWDYAVAYEGAVYFAEVHPASDSDVSKLCAKAIWLKKWLRENAPEIEKLKAKGPLWWIHTKGHNISIQGVKKAAGYGIKIISPLQLPLALDASNK